MTSYNKIIGIWNFGNTPFKWGNCLLFNQSLHLLKFQYDCPNVELVIYADPINGFRTEKITIENKKNYIEKIKSVFLLYDISSKSKYDLFLKNISSDTLIFPPGYQKKFQDFDFKSYLGNQKLIEKGYKLSFAKINQNQRKEAKQFFKKLTLRKVVA
ncbi:hypothetical protein ACFLSY_05830, partial [Bacteroidota bacterium]